MPLCGGRGDGNGVRNLNDYDGCFVRLADEFAVWSVDNGKRAIVHDIDELHSLVPRLTIVLDRDQLEAIPLAESVAMPATRMFAYLDGFRVVLVTGPQRSGTTIAAKMIANDTGLRFVPEEEFKHHNKSQWDSLINTRNRIVIQCPTMCRYVDKYGKADDIAVVLMVRPLEEIIASQKRINWPAAEKQRELARYDRKRGEPAKVKYDYWIKYQVNDIKHAYEIQFNSLASHPLWIPKEKRNNFRARQTS